MHCSERAHLAIAWETILRGPLGEARDPDARATTSSARTKNNSGSFEFTAYLKELAEAGQGAAEFKDPKKRCKVCAVIHHNELKLNLQSEKNKTKSFALGCYCLPYRLKRRLKTVDSEEEATIGGKASGWQIDIQNIRGVGLWHSVRSFNRGILFQVILDLAVGDGREKQLRLHSYESDVANIFVEAVNNARNQQGVETESPSCAGDEVRDTTSGLTHQLHDDADSTSHHRSRLHQGSSTGHSCQLLPMTLQEQLQGPLAQLPACPVTTGPRALRPSLLTQAASLGAKATSGSHGKLPPILLPQEISQQESLLHECGFQDCSRIGREQAAGDTNTESLSAGTYSINSIGSGDDQRSPSRHFMPGALPSPQRAVYAREDAAVLDEQCEAAGYHDTSLMALQKEKSEIFSFSAIGWDSPADLDNTLPLMGTMPQGSEHAYNGHLAEMQPDKSIEGLRQDPSASADEGEISFACESLQKMPPSAAGLEYQIHEIAIMKGHCDTIGQTHAHAHRYGLFPEDSEFGFSSTAVSMHPQTGTSPMQSDLSQTKARRNITLAHDHMQDEDKPLCLDARNVVAQREACGMSHDMAALMLSLGVNEEETSNGDNNDIEYSDFVDTAGESFEKGCESETQVIDG